MTAPALAAPADLIARAVLTLAGKCDGAREQDGVGFNRYDADWGRRTAESLTDGHSIDFVKAHRIVSKYRKQLQRAGLELPPVEDVQQLQPIATVAPSAQSPARSGVRIAPIASSIHHVKVAFPYDVELVAKIKSLDVAKRQFNGVDKSWTVAIDQLPKLTELFPDATIEGALADTINEARAKAEEARLAADAAELALQATIAQDIARYERILETIEKRPYQHQDDGIRWLIERRKAILADDMGLGKTYQALVAARAIGHHTIVVAPAGLRDNWLREAEQVNHRIEVHSWAKVPTLPKNKKFTLIADEAHYAQNMKAQRTQNFLALAKGAEASFILTGTPIKNGRPTNLFPLLVAIDHALSKNRKHFERYYCNAGPTRWTRWDVTGAAHLEELHEEIADSLLRRMKEDVLDLPEKTRVKREAELSGESQRLYDQALDELRATYFAKVEAGEISSEGEALVMLGIVRKAASIAKADSAIEIAEELMDNNQSVVLFSWYRETADYIAKKLGAGVIDGGVDSTKRQALIDEFQAGSLLAMSCTYAGGVGITLTKAQTVILVDRPWTPGDAVQAEDRIYRIGQRNACTAVWLRTGELDHWLDDEVLEGKWERSNVVLTGEAGDSLIRDKDTGRTAKQFLKELFA